MPPAQERHASLIARASSRSSSPLPRRKARVHRDQGASEEVKHGEVSDRETREENGELSREIQLPKAPPLPPASHMARSVIAYFTASLSSETWIGPVPWPNRSPLANVRHITEEPCT